MATRYEKLAVRYEATITIAAINQWLRVNRAGFRGHSFDWIEGTVRMVSVTVVFGRSSRLVRTPAWADVADGNEVRHWIPPEEDAQLPHP